LNGLLSAQNNLEKQVNVASQDAAAKDRRSAATADPTESALSTAGLPADVVARLRATGVTIPDQQGSGHGVTSCDAQKADPRCRS
jgi:hypothetical protein